MLLRLECSFQLVELVEDVGTIVSFLVVVSFLTVYLLLTVVFFRRNKVDLIWVVCASSSSSSPIRPKSWPQSGTFLGDYWLDYDLCGLSQLAWKLW